MLILTMVIGAIVPTFFYCIFNFNLSKMDNENFCTLII